jgi:hypothetical protein
MQAGMMIGRAAMGGGALLLLQVMDFRAVTLALSILTASSMLLLVPSRDLTTAVGGSRQQVAGVVRALVRALRSRNTWLGLIFALVGGAAFKSLEVVLGPFLIDRGFDRNDVGWFSAGPMIGLMLAGAVAGGILADRFERKPFVMVALGAFVSSIALLAGADWLADHSRGYHLFALLSITAFAIGLFTSASYALFMDLTDPSIAATQFSAFMGATNGCESWSTYVMGKIVASSGYPTAMLCMCGVSLCALPALRAMRVDSEPPQESPATP